MTSAKEIEDAANAIAPTAVNAMAMLVGLAKLITPRLADHERRIRALEQAAGIVPPVSADDPLTAFEAALGGSRD